jgi:ABC-2 type transport system permease protein
VKQSQLRTLLWLRWRLTKNQWKRGGALGAVAAALRGLLGAWGALAGFVGGILVGAYALHGSRALFVMLTWLGFTIAFLFLWTLGTLMDLQRSEIVDLPRLMHLPITLSRAFALNYLTSLMGFTMAAFLPATLGLSIGLAVDRGPSMMLLAPLSLGLLFMVTAWTYLFQGSLAMWVQNPRRRRVLVTAIALSVALCGQVPNLVLSVYGPRQPGAAATREEKDAFSRAQEARYQVLRQRFLLAEKIVPPLWLPGGAGRLAEGDPVFALLGTVGFAALGAFALRRGYQSTLRFYGGGTGGGESPRRASEPQKLISPSVPGRRRLVERQLPGVHDQTAAVAVATLRSLLRAPEILMSLGFGMLMMVILVVSGGGLLFRHRLQMGAHMAPLIVVGAMFMTAFPVASLVNNQFGHDRDGFRALLLAPIARQRLLLGKNLALLPIAALPCGAVLIAGSLWLRLPAFAMLAAGLQMVSLLLTLSMTGNLLSILLPFRVRGGAMKATPPPAGIVLALAGIQLCFPVLCFPAYAGPAAVVVGHYLSWTHPVIVDFVLSLSMAAAAAFAYRASLAPLGRLLQRRETLILAQVTVEQE